MEVLVVFNISNKNISTIDYGLKSKVIRWNYKVREKLKDRLRVVRIVKMDEDDKGG